MIQRERPHVILCDINMPGTNGVDFFSLVRGDRRFDSVPFVFLSGLFTPEDAMRLADPRTRVPGPITWPSPSAVTTSRA